MIKIRLHFTICEQGNVVCCSIKRVLGSGGIWAGRDAHAPPPPISAVVQKSMRHLGKFWCVRKIIFGAAPPCSPTFWVRVRVCILSSVGYDKLKPYGFPIHGAID